VPWVDLEYDISVSSLTALLLLFRSKRIEEGALTLASTEVWKEIFMIPDYMQCNGQTSANAVYCFVACVGSIQV
jgi:hypothetical protein